MGSVYISFMKSWVGTCSILIKWIINKMNLNAMRLILKHQLLHYKYANEIATGGMIHVCIYLQNNRIHQSGLLIGLNEYVYEACHEVNSASIMKCLASSPMFTL